MTFYGTPNLYVRISDRYKRFFPIRGFSFNDKGEYTTDNETLIRLLKQQFEYEGQAETITDENNASAGDKTYKCKHCEFTANTPIQLAQHSRKEHPKGDKK